MEVANELKNLTYDINTVGLYDEEEERRRIENTKINTAEEKGVKKGIEQGKLEMIKEMLKNDISISKIAEISHMSKKDILNIS